MKKRHSSEQIIRILGDIESSVLKVSDACRPHGINPRNSHGLISCYWSPVMTMGVGNCREWGADSLEKPLWKMVLISTTGKLRADPSLDAEFSYFRDLIPGIVNKVDCGREGIPAITCQTL